MVFSGVTYAVIYGICDFSLEKYGNAYLLCEIKHGGEISLLIFIEQESEIIVSHRLQ